MAHRVARISLAARAPAAEDRAAVVHPDLSPTMRRLLRLALGSGLVLVLAFLVFAYAPLPGLAEPGTHAGSHERELEALAWFDAIAETRNLERPFPAMVTREGNAHSEARAELGRLLYFDPLLSATNQTSCAHCHHPDLGFADNRPLSMGFGGSGVGPERTGGHELGRNTPTIWNAAYSATQFWDGRARDLEEQAEGPIQHPDEMGQDADELVLELRAVPEYVELFEAAFEGAEESISLQTTTFAIAAFERTILSADSAFDRYAAGERDALDDAQRRGLSLFRSLKTRCFECHNLPHFADPEFKVIGVPERDGVERDLGRFAVEGAGYEHAFKVPTLRNIALTGPYMHNGIFETLEEVIDFYSLGGGRAFPDEVPNIDDKIRVFELSSSERADLIAFLHALTDESQKPAIPASVPSGLPVVSPLENRSPELAAAAERSPRAPSEIRREGAELYVESGQRIQDAIDLAQTGDTVHVAAGVYHETLTLDVSGVTLLGTGAETVLDGQGVLADAVVGSGHDLRIQGFRVQHYTANGVMINRAARLVFEDLHCVDTGLYGLYPVEVDDVQVLDCSVTGARDAGIYVGQSRNVLVKGCEAWANVTGIEIENCADAVVEDNHVWDNAGGILVFLLPNNPSKISRGCVVRGNRVIENNHENFAAEGSIVAGVPSGTGVMLLAADEVEVTGNEIRGNGTTGVVVLGLHSVLGADTAFDVDPTPERNWIHDNDFVDNGQAPDPGASDYDLEAADLIWDLSGYDNSWDEEGASMYPSSLPRSNWSGMRRRATHRMWQVLAKL